MSFIHKMDLKELYILSFYFHAIDFILKKQYGKVWFYKIKGHMMKFGQCGPLPRHNTVMSCPLSLPRLRNRCDILGRRAKLKDCKFLCFLSAPSASQLYSPSLH